MFSSLHAPVKLVPQSDRIIVAGPRMAKNRRSALMKLDASIDSISSIWMAHTDKHVKITAHLLL